MFYAEGYINYVDVRDVADMIYKIYEHPHPGEKFIANSGCINLRELLRKIALRLGKKEPSIKINDHLLGVAAWLEEMRCRLSDSEALISRQSIKMSGEKFVYPNQKSIKRLNMAYRPLDETLDWCCEYYRSAFTTNK